MFLGIKQRGGRVPLPPFFIRRGIFYNPPVKVAPGFKGLLACLQHVSVQLRGKKKRRAGNSAQLAVFVSCFLVTSLSGFQSCAPL